MSMFKIPQRILLIEILDKCDFAQETTDALIDGQEIIEYCDA